jgi:LysM domain
MTLYERDAALKSGSYGDTLSYLFVFTGRSRPVFKEQLPMRNRASLILFIFIILLVIILAQNGVLGSLISSLGGSEIFSVTVQPGLPTVRPLIFVTPTPRNQILPPPLLPTVYSPPVYAPTYPGQPTDLPGTGPTAVPQGVPSGGQCIVPNGWVPYTIQAGETLANIAAAYNLTAEQLASANCLPNPDLIYEGQVIAVPNRQ